MAVVPVAGRGTRMFPLSRAIPKELLPLGRKPIVHHVIDELVAAGVRELVFVTSPGKPAIRTYLQNDDFWRGQLAEWTRDPVRMHFVEQERALGLGDAIRRAAAIVGNRRFLVALGDCAIDGPVSPSLTQRILNAANHLPDGGVIALQQVPLEEVTKYGVAAIAERAGQLWIRDLVEKPSPQQAPSRWAIAGRYLLQPAVFDQLARIETGRGGELQLTDAIAGLIRAGIPMLGEALSSGERRLDVGDFASYHEAFLAMANRQLTIAEPIAPPRISTHPRSRTLEQTGPAIVGRAHARAGLLGNPSDGYGGKVISCIVANWSAEVRLLPSSRIRFVAGSGEPLEFESLDHMTQSLRRHGYYGGVRLLQAAAKRFADYCRQSSIPCPDLGFDAEYHTDIPRQLGLGGSSAIIIAMIRALAKLYRANIPQEWLPSLALAVEREELGIPAGLQDRVIQSYEGLMYMDFAEPTTDPRTDLVRGSYERLDERLLPDLYVAICPAAAEPTEIVHSDLRKRFERGDPAVVSAMRQFAEFARLGREALLRRDYREWNRLIDANFDLRRSICAILPEHLQLIEAARSVGGSAKFCGSGGAIVGTLLDPSAWDRLTQVLARLGAKVVRPEIGVWAGSG
jgi:glucuronokinase